MDHPLDDLVERRRVVEPLLPAVEHFTRDRDLEEIRSAVGFRRKSGSLALDVLHAERRVALAVPFLGLADDVQRRILGEGVELRDCLPQRQDSGCKRAFSSVTFEPPPSAAIMKVPSSLSMSSRT